MAKNKLDTSPGASAHAPRIFVRAPEALRTEFAKLCAKRGRTVSDEIRAFMRSELNSQPVGKRKKEASP